MTCQTLYRSAALEITSCIGDASRRSPAAMHFESFEAHFQDDGAYTLHDGPRAVLVDVHHVELRRAGTTRTYSRPAVSADRGTSIRFSAAVLDVLSNASDDSPPAEFPTGVVRLGPRGFRHLRALRRAVAEPPNSAAEYVEARAVALLARVVRSARHARYVDATRRASTSARHQESVERVKEFLAERLQDRPTFVEAANTADYAPHHFARIFRDRTGLSVHQYLTELRLRQAAVRLDDGAANLSSLALDLGFSSQSHFTTAFRSWFGCTPSEYRKSRR